MKLHRGNTAMLLGVHLLCLAGPSTFTWSGLALCVFFFWVSSGLGITLGWHRLLTHRAFDTPRWLRLFFTACGCLTLQHGPIEWVGTHRQHHRHTDGDDDPHSPRHGFFWSHLRWTSLHTEPDPRPYARDLQRDPGVAVHGRRWWEFDPTWLTICPHAAAAWRGTSKTPARCPGPATNATRRSRRHTPQLIPPSPPAPLPGRSGL
ncbi:MAG: acyl-CoA desaturase [Planctomycetota bacterium]